MSEITTQISATRVEMGCDVCKLGTYVWGGQVTGDLPPSYRHFCSHCTNDAKFFVTYPHVIEGQRTDLIVPDLPDKSNIVFSHPGHGEVDITGAFPPDLLTAVRPARRPKTVNGLADTNGNGIPDYRDSTDVIKPKRKKKATNV